MNKLARLLNSGSTVSPSASSSLVTPNDSAISKACSRFSRLLCRDTTSMSIRSGLKKELEQKKALFCFFPVCLWSSDSVYVYQILQIISAASAVKISPNISMRSWITVLVWWFQIRVRSNHFNHTTRYIVTSICWNYINHFDITN